MYDNKFFFEYTHACTHKYMYLVDNIIWIRDFLQIFLDTKVFFW